MNIQRYNATMSQLKGREDRIIVQGIVAAMTMAGLGLIKGYKERKAALVIISLFLIAIIIAFLYHYYS